MLLLLACVSTPVLVDTALEDEGEKIPGDTGPIEDIGETGDTGTTTTGDDWSRFEAERAEHLAALGVPILECVAHTDSSDPIFHGCYDWHSAVHGHWALYVITRLTGDPSWAEAAEERFDETSLAAEEAILEARIAGEIPYGYAWFLALARERRAWGEAGLDPLAEIVAADLEAHIVGLSESQGRQAALADEYANLSWAILNLWEDAEDRGDTETAGVMEEQVRTRLFPLDDDCPLAEELWDTDNFFPACLMRARTILRVLPEDEASAWLEGVLPEDYPLTPVVNVQTPHESGLNFSRPWGLWSVWRATGDPAWRGLYLDHVVGHIEHPEYWAENYVSYSHWVPQFGVYAIAVSVDEAP